MFSRRYLLCICPVLEAVCSDSPSSTSPSHCHLPHSLGRPIGHTLSLLLSYRDSQHALVVQPNILCSLHQTNFHPHSIPVERAPTFSATMSSSNPSQDYKSPHPSERIPTTGRPVPSSVSILYASALQNLYRKKANNGLGCAMKPHASTSLDDALSRPRACRSRSAPEFRAWTGEREHNMWTYSKDPRGILPSRRIEQHGMQEGCGSDGKVFPPTWVVERGKREEKLYPQYGEFKGKKVCEERRCPAHRTSRVRQQQKEGPVVFQPCLKGVFTSCTITKSALPAPWCNMTEPVFQDWFVQNLAAIGISAEFSHARLAAMSREEDRQKWRAADSEKVSGKEARMMHNILPPEALRQLLATTGQPDPPELDGALVMEIKEHLKCIAERRRARRDAARGYAAPQRQSVGTAGQGSANETWFVQKCKAGWRGLWT